MSNQKGFRGYISSRPVRGEMTPQHIQNMLIRQYAKQHDLFFLLSATEYAMPSCFMMLESVVRDLESLEGIILFTLFMLPANPARRSKIYRQIIDTGSALHCALEGICLVGEQDISLFEDLFMIQQLAVNDNSQSIEYLKRFSITE